MHNSNPLKRESIKIKFSLFFFLRLKFSRLILTHNSNPLKCESIKIKFSLFFKFFFMPNTHA